MLGKEGLLLQIIEAVGIVIVKDTKIVEVTVSVENIVDISGVEYKTALDSGKVASATVDNTSILGLDDVGVDRINFTEVDSAEVALSIGIVYELFPADGSIEEPDRTVVAEPVAELVAKYIDLYRFDFVGDIPDIRLETAASCAVGHKSLSQGKEADVLQVAQVGLPRAYIDSVKVTIVLNYQYSTSI